ncbi:MULTISPECIES: hypothetical protein [unclassified Sphingomonas]|jgi:hypothetical protein|nr:MULTISPECIES: hypothetical protein [unclassified Sphingomonas]
MADPEDTTEVSGTEARSGATPHVTRYVLGVSLVVIVILFAVLLAIGMR